MKKWRIVLILLLAIAFIAGIIGYGYAQGSTPTSGAGAGCCACASAYAKTDDARLNMIREFRDKYLMTNPLGRGIAALYYNVFSPPVAHYINSHPEVKPLARTVLMPVVAFSAVATDTTLAEKIAILVFIAFASGALLVWLRWRRHKRLQGS